MHLNFMQQQKNILDYFFSNIDPNILDDVTEKILNCSGNILLTGVGKSGHTAELIATMLTSVGTKAFFISPVNALHGDLGIISPNDLVILLSKSGNTQELKNLALILKEQKIQTMGWFCSKDGYLNKLCDETILLPLQKELCPYDLAPTTSTILQLIFGNTLAVTLMEKKKFSLESYRKNHPSGTIGKKISCNVETLMITKKNLPLCSTYNTVQEILVELSDKRCGCILVLDEEKKLKGVFTDGDLRRAIEKDKEKVFSTPIENYMTKEFLSIQPNLSIIAALEVMQKGDQRKKIQALPVLENDQLIGLIRIHDILSLS